jgi:hypothetical protein
VSRHAAHADREAATYLAIGPQTAARVAKVGDPHVFKNGRGLLPGWGSPLDSTRAAARSGSGRSLAGAAWARKLKARRHVKVAGVALVAKHARIAWAIFAHGTEYRPAGPQTAVT